MPREATTAVVLRSERVTPHLIRVTLGGDGLRAFDPGPFTDAYLKMRFPAGDATRVRSLTIRSWDAAAGELALEVVDHGDVGFAGPWAAGAQPGDTIEFLGPGGAYAPDPQADWHLLVGDGCVLPAIAASLAHVPTGVPVHVVVEVASAEDEIELSSPGDLTVTWLHGDGGLPAAVRALELPAGRGHVFVHGEAEAMRDLRRHLLADRGLGAETLSLSGYWKRGRDDEGWRADKAEWKRQVEQDTATLAAR